MILAPRPHVLAASLLIATGAACGDDTSGTGGAGGGASTSSGSTTTSASTTTSGSSSSTASSGGGEGGGGASGGGGGAGGEAPTCTADEAPDAPCDAVEHVGQTCTVEVAGGGCPDTTIVWRCTDYEGGPFWNRVVDTNCFCSMESDEESCTALPGCVWADPPDGMCGDDESDATPIPETGCYRDGCGNPGFGLLGLVGGETCSDDLCEAYAPD